MKAITTLLLLITFALTSYPQDEACVTLKDIPYYEGSEKQQDEYIRQEYGMKDTHPLVDQYAPLYHVRPDAPPLLLITGDREQEMLGRYEENAYLARMMKAVGHSQTRLLERQGYGHGMT